ncbi:MAG: DUF1566 domain-containing protein [Desulfuromonadales bacterium]|nr:DUF1566 domain-containing protein [Desulfuromonadales bacterium]
MSKRVVMICLVVFGWVGFSFAGSVILPQTGQQTCYDTSGNVTACTSTGQDGDLQSGVPWPSPRFVDNLDNTVGDKLTSSVWTKDAGAPDATLCGVTTPMTWQQALSYVACLNTNSYAGVNDWALPNASQLMSLINYSQTSNDLWLGNDFNNVDNSNNYWTSDTYVTNASDAWSVDLTDGSTSTDDKANTSNAVWPVRLAGDLIVEYVIPETAYENGKPVFTTGTTVSVNASIKNIGNYPTSGGSRTYFFVSDDNSFDIWDTLIYWQNDSVLQPGQSMPQSATTLVPFANIPSGDYYLGVLVDELDTTAELDETNNVYSMPVTVKNGPDLIVTNVSAPADALTGSTVTVTATVRNDGVGTSTVDNRAYLYASTDANITKSDFMLSGGSGFETLHPISAGSETLLTFDDYSFTGLAPGDYYVGVIVDDWSQVYEYDEENNSGYDEETMSVTCGPDLIISSIDGIPTEVYAGDRLSTVTMTAKNIGSTASGAFYGYLYLSTDNVITTADTQLGIYQSFTATGPGVENTRTLSPFNLPQVTGQYFIGAIVDPGNQICESNTGNNTSSSIEVNLAYGPDLTVSEVDAPLTATSGVNVTIPVTIQNIGVRNVSSGHYARAKLYASVDTDITSSDTQIGSTFFLPTIPAGAETTVNFTFDFPSLSAGDYYIGAIADGTSKVNESNENNNTGYDVDAVDVN